MSDAVRALYQEIIVEHGAHPRHRGALATPTHAAELDNPLCGDIVKLQLAVEGDRIAGVAHAGHGCTLSIAAASLFAEQLIGRTLAEAGALAAELEAMVAEAAGAPDRAQSLGSLAVLAGVREFRSRRACATLAARALVRAIAARRG
ncbi:MAG TPA: SUF system NifU family Fe-S cluster assembly protein [Kofleriaceae bacterium]|jgi:nitrogen fixation NifU-like protein